MSRRKVLNIGIDLGTSRSVIACDNGVRTFVPSFVGYPKDAVSRKMFKSDIVYGDEAMRNKMALNLYRPFDKGQLKYSDTVDRERDMAQYKKTVKVARDLLKHLVKLGLDDDDNEFADQVTVRAVLGAPALASQKNKKNLLEVADGIIDDVMVATEPFCVAYGLGLFTNALIIDIGAGTVDLCRMHGTIPTTEDQITTLKAGDFVDKVFFDLIMKQHPDANFTVNMIKQFKEDNAQLSDKVESVHIELPVNGKPTRYDVTEELKLACRAIVPDIVEGIKKLISGFDPEFQRGLKENVILAGGGSQIVGLKKEIEVYMQQHLGYGRVTKVEEPLYAGANGALKLCKDMPDEYWLQVRSKTQTSAHSEPEAKASA